MKQTPGPWAIAVTARVLCEPCMADIVDDEGVEVATGVRYKHAVNILRCVNSHDRLVQALELARTGIKASPEVMAHIGGNVLPAIEQALALARATGYTAR